MEITEIGLLCVKGEIAYGIDAAPDGTNAIPTVGDSLTYNVQSTPVDRKSTDGTLDRLPGYNALTHVVLKFKYELRGNRTDGIAPDISSGNSSHAVEIDALLKAANLTPTYSVETSSGARDGNVVYSPTIYTSSGPSVTCYWWTGLKKHKLTGGKVDLKCTYEAGRVPIIEFTVTGLYSGVTDETLPTPTFVITKPPLVEGASVTISGLSTVLSKLEFALGNRVVLRKSAGSINGIAGFVITSYDPKGSADPEAVSEATLPFWQYWKTSNPAALLIQVGSSSGNKTALNGSCAEARKIGYTNRWKTRADTTRTPERKTTAFFIIVHQPNAASLQNGEKLRFQPLSCLGSTAVLSGHGNLLADF